MKEKTINYEEKSQTTICKTFFFYLTISYLELSAGFAAKLLTDEPDCKCPPAGQEFVLLRAELGENDPPTTTMRAGHATPPLESESQSI